MFHLRIDKFLEGYSSDGEELPVKQKVNEFDDCELQVNNNKNELCVGKTVSAINSSNLVSIYINLIFFIVECYEYLLIINQSFLKICWLLFINSCIYIKKCWIINNKKAEMSRLGIVRWIQGFETNVPFLKMWFRVKEVGCVSL